MYNMEREQAVGIGGAPARPRIAVLYSGRFFGPAISGSWARNHLDNLILPNAASIFVACDPTTWCSAPASARSAYLAGNRSEVEAALRAQAHAVRVHRRLPFFDRLRRPLFDSRLLCCHGRSFAATRSCTLLSSPPRTRTCLTLSERLPSRRCASLACRRQTAPPSSSTDGEAWPLARARSLTPCHLIHVIRAAAA